MEKKEFYRHALPHFQRPGQAYFVTWSLKDAISSKSLDNYKLKLFNLHSTIQILLQKNTEFELLELTKTEYCLTQNKFMKAYDDLLHVHDKSIINLSNESNRKIVVLALTYWEDKRIQNYAFCVMSNHVHWVFKVFEKDNKDQPVYLQDILQSVKHFSASQINKNEGLKGTLWQKESYDTTIRDDKHLHNAIDYTINNPVKAGLVDNWYEWKGTN